MKKTYVKVCALRDRRETEKLAAIARRDMRWDDLSQLLMFPDMAESARGSREPAKEETCSMCGDFCAMRKCTEVFKDDIAPNKLAPV
jgi:5-hydroxybenzimidazole synthase